VILLTTVTGTLAACVGVSAVEQGGFARYQIIIDRAPFGVTAGGPVAEAQPGFSTRYTFVGLVKTESSGTLLAIIYDKDKNRSYFLAEGETIPNENVKLVRIERSTPSNKIVLQQGLESATLSYQPAGTAPTAASPSPGAPPPAQQPGQVPGRRRIPFMRGGG
jgi:hypothetical protein